MNEWMNREIQTWGYEGLFGLNLHANCWPWSNLVWTLRCSNISFFVFCLYSDQEIKRINTRESLLHPRSMLEVTFNSESATANCWHGPLAVTLQTLCVCCFKHWSWTVVQCCQTTVGHSESGFTASQCSLIGPRQTDSMAKGQSWKVKL